MTKLQFSSLAVMVVLMTAMSLLEASSLMSNKKRQKSGAMQGPPYHLP